MRIIKIGLIAFTAFALLLQSCQKKGPEANSGRYPILFNCAGYDTKAISTEQDLKDYGFVVRADYSLNGDEFSFQQDVNYNADNKVWAGTTTEYWWPGASYTFSAIYPKLSEQNLSFIDGGYQIKNFDVTSQIDIIAATAERQVSSDKDAPTEGSVVNLQFQHLLANVTIKIKAQVDNVIIRKITIGDAETLYTYNGSQWTGSNKTSISIEPARALIKGADYVDVTQGGILVIPASSNKPLTIEASNKIYNVEIPSGTWEQGVKYSYTLEIKQDDIIFVDGAPYVETWDSENATGSVIIK